MVFSDNVEFINNHNKEADEGKHTFWVEVNEYADWTQAELKARNNLKVRNDDLEEPQVKTDPDPDRPANLDWRDYVSYVTKLSIFTFTVYRR